MQNQTGPGTAEFSPPSDEQLEPAQDQSDGVGVAEQIQHVKQDVATRRKQHRTHQLAGLQGVAPSKGLIDSGVARLPSGGLVNHAATEIVVHKVGVGVPAGLAKQFVNFKIAVRFQVQNHRPGTVGSQSQRNQIVMAKNTANRVPVNRVVVWFHDEKNRPGVWPGRLLIIGPGG